MKYRIIFFSIAVVVTLSLLNVSCSKDSGSNNPPAAKDTILLNIGNNIILPGYQSLASAVNALDAAIIDFNAGPSGNKLSNIQALFKTAYNAWQPVSAYNYFGPASGAQPVLTSLNVFPVSVTQVENNITAGTYNVNTFANTVAKGFPALDYLLFNTDNTSLLASYSTDANALNRQKYLAAVSADIKVDVNNVLNNWTSTGGNYINTFVSGTGNSVSSSLGLLMNSLDQDFEILKNDKLGIPLGKIPVGSSLPLAPAEVEAYYSGMSVQLAVTQLKAAQGIYLGSSTQGGNGLGLVTYLKQAEQQKDLHYNGGLLSDTISVEFLKAINDLQSIPDPLSANLSNPNVSAAFAECQRLVTLLKTDMPSDLGVLINYGDNDGD